MRNRALSGKLTLESNTITDEDIAALSALPDGPIGQLRVPDLPALFALRVVDGEAGRLVFDVFGRKPPERIVKTARFADMAPTELSSAMNAVGVTATELAGYCGVDAETVKDWLGIGSGSAAKRAGPHVRMILALLTKGDARALADAVVRATASPIIRG